jgi:2-iminobutanoate/2-iminopropanoate deaminase
MPDKKIVKTDMAPQPIGPYSAGIKTDCFVFTAGQIAIDPVTGELVSGGIAVETRQVLNNIQNILEAAGSSMDLVVKTTVFLRDMSDFSEMNAVYAEFFKQNPPARSTVQVSALPKNVAVEIEATAILKD